MLKFRYLPVILILVILAFSGCQTTDRITVKEAAEAYFNLGNAYSELNRHQEAVLAYTRARQLDPELLSAGYNLARVFIMLEKYDESLKQLDELLKTDSENRILLETKAWIYHLQNNNTKALEIYNGILETFESSRNSLHNSALLLIEEDEKEEALRRFKKLYELYPDEDSAVLQIAVLEAGLENYEEASLWLEKRLDFDPDDLEALELAGDVFKERLMYADAVKAYRRITAMLSDGESASDKAPDNSNRLGRVYFKTAEILLKSMEDYEGGLTALKKSVDSGWKSREDFDRLLEETDASWYSRAFELLGTEEFSDAE